MANEIRGILYETITEVALKRAVQIAGIPGEVRWNVTPQGMSVVPDFTIGIDQDKPSHVVLVTASGSSGDSHKKFGRNLAEMLEVKVQLQDAPLVLNIYFLSEIKEGLSAAMEHLYDAVLHADREAYYPALQSWVTENLRSVVKDRAERRALLNTALESHAELATAIEALAKHLAEILKLRKTDLAPLWRLMQVDFARAHAVPSARTTAVRRGLGKLMVIEPAVRRRIYKDYRRPIPTGELPGYALELGFFTKGVAGARLSDSEIVSVLDLLGPETCEDLIQRAPAAMEPWIGELRQLDNLGNFLAFADRKFEDIGEPNSLLLLLKECQGDPQAFAQAQNISFSGQLHRNWLFTMLMDLVKASTGRLTGFGYAQLASEVGKSAGLSSGYIIIADWANRVPGVNMPEPTLQSVSEVLAKRVTEIGKRRLQGLGTTLNEVTRKSILEDRLIPYRNFEPLLWLLEAELQKQGKTYVPKQPYGGWINDYAGLGRGSATTPFVRIGGTLVHWKSVSYAGKVHKKKELAARARSVKYTYNPKAGTFDRHAEVEQLGLIVDGTFDNNDLKVLAEAGWDIIVYPDEIADLVSRL